jgi:N-acetyl-gamma-glutamyl-phosphate reductase
VKTGDLALETAGEAATKSGGEGLVRAAVAGSTGYSGRELLALLARHPAVRLVRLMSSGREGKGARPVAVSHPALRAKVRLAIEPLDVKSLVPEEADVVFLATPHEASHEIAPRLVDRGLKVIDLSGAFRLRDAAAYPRWYGFAHQAAAALAEAVYGIPELNAEAIHHARLVANPGCYATSIILALAPLVQAGWADISAGIICDAKSGASGAGRAPSEKLHFVEVNENLRAYGLFSHRHVPEMLQALDLDEKDFLFTPHLLPISRGLLSTIYVRLTVKRSIAEVSALFAEFYAQAPLVRLYESGTLPEIQGVAHTNYTDIGFALDEATGRLIVVSALDNLGKGAAGQAVQNMNLMFGFAEETGLV